MKTIHLALSGVVIGILFVGAVELVLIEKAIEQQTQKCMMGDDR